jgi:hypothetical protein
MLGVSNVSMHRAIHQTPVIARICSNIELHLFNIALRISIMR